ncbi:ESCRT-0 subunit protein hse1 [Massospora cicadina]|nr:ESCRT-0 subunit protein hse1 [Massospora cicadina]
MVKNCDLLAKREVASRAFTTTLSRVLADPDAHAKVKERILYLIQDWTEQFKTDASLNLMEELYSKLKTQETESKTSGTRKPLLSKSESNISKTNTALASGRPVTKPKEKFQVRALFDFIPSEKGELGFHKGDIIKVIDDQYKNWWKGELHSQIGIFPANYVEKLPESVSLDDVALLELEASVNKDAAMMNELLRDLHALNPNDNIGENEKLHEMYSSSLLIRPKLLKLISAYSLKKESLMNLNEKFVKARTEFERLQYGHAPSHISHGHPGHTNSNQEKFNLQYTVLDPRLMLLTSLLFPLAILLRGHTLDLFGELR